MTLLLYAHPFSSYSQKVLIPLYENATPFTYRNLHSDDPTAGEELKALWPVNRFPVLVEDGRTILESSVIIEYLGLRHPGPVRMIPADRKAALEVRMLDRFFDNYIMTPMNTLVFQRMREADDPDRLGVARACEMLGAALGWLDRRMADREWAVGDSFTLADCAAAPSLFYADWVYPFEGAWPEVSRYRTRLLDRPSFARAVDEARPYRGLFPGGAPDRD